MTNTPCKHQTFDFSLESPFQAARSLLCLFVCLFFLHQPALPPPTFATKGRQDYDARLKLPFNLARRQRGRRPVRIYTAAERHASLPGFKLLQSRSSRLSLLSRVKKSVNFHILGACGMSTCFPALTFVIRLRA